MLEAVFILLEFPSPSRRFFIGYHSLPPSLVRRIGPSLGFMEETRMPLVVALCHEEPLRDPSFEYRWPFQLGKPLIRPKLVLKPSPKMYKFHEWFMQQSVKGVHSIGMLAAPEDFTTEGNKVVWLEFKDIYEVYR
jgi:hypothetical protein